MRENLKAQVLMVFALSVDGKDAGDPPRPAGKRAFFPFADTGLSRVLTPWCLLRTQRLDLGSNWPTSPENAALWITRGPTCSRTRPIMASQPLHGPYPHSFSGGGGITIINTSLPQNSWGVVR